MIQRRSAGAAAWEAVRGAFVHRLAPPRRARSWGRHRSRRHRVDLVTTVAAGECARASNDDQSC